jgi:hypothetical protein
MDKSIRKNEICSIGLPSCDYVFSSTRSCFIAYGFDESKLEMDLLKSILKDNEIDPIEAGGNIKPASSAFCTKICSKIITAQFCIVLINNSEQKNIEIPNANVNMEYGLMLGFNKYVIPFQRETQKLPFNVAGLDTIKYSEQNFTDKAVKAINVAINETKQESKVIDAIDQILQTFLLIKKTTYADVSGSGDKQIYDLGSNFGFNLLIDFSGLKYVYFGNKVEVARQIGNAIPPKMGEVWGKHFLRLFGSSW